MYSFIEEYANIRVPTVNRFTLQKGESLYINGKKYNGELEDGLNTVSNGNLAETSVLLEKIGFIILTAHEKVLRYANKNREHIARVGMDIFLASCMLI